MSEKYEYGQYADANRFINLDGIEAKIITHFIYSNSKYANYIWKILKYNTKDALSQNDLTTSERIALVEGYNGSSAEALENTRVFFSPFVDDAWNKEASSIYVYIENIKPFNHENSLITVAIDTVIHSKINIIYGDADLIANPNNTNINDYYHNDMDNPAVQYKSRASVLLKCIMAELNGLYIDGVGYLYIDKDKATADINSTGTKVSMNLFNRKSFFGHSIHFNLAISGISETAEEGF